MSLKEELACLFCSWNGNCIKAAPKGNNCILAEQIAKKAIKDLRLVQLDEDQVIPEFVTVGGISETELVRQTQQAMLDAKFRKMKED